MPDIPNPVPNEDPEPNPDTDPGPDPGLDPDPDPVPDPDKIDNPEVGCLNADKDEGLSMPIIGPPNPLEKLLRWDPELSIP